MRRSSSTPLLLLLVGMAFAVGCASTQSAQEEAAAQAAVVGTWKYDVEGIAPLEQGVFHITTRNGQLQGLVQDRRRGRLRARVRVSDSRLELTVDDLRISGYIEDDQFTGFLRLQQWSVTTRARRWNRRSAPFQSASLFAQRVRSAALAEKPSILECRPLLRETDDCDS